MKRLILTFNASLILAALLSACAHPESSGSASNNTAQQANSNSTASQGAASAVTPSGGTPLAVQQLPAPAKPPETSAARPASPPAAEGAATSNTAAKAGPAPKLVAPEKRLDFGKQPQDRNLVRAIIVRNGGKADLKIESVVPS